MICQEFDSTEQTVAKRWKLRDIPPAKDGTWTTKEVCKIIFGDKEGERLRLTTEQADKLSLENAQKRRELVPVDTVLIAGQRFIAAAKPRILASSMSDQEKDLVLQDISNLATEKMIDVSER